MDRESEKPPRGPLEPNRQLDKHGNGQTRRLGLDERRDKGWRGRRHRILESGGRVQGEDRLSPLVLSFLARAYTDVFAYTKFKVTRESLQFKHKLSPYQGFVLKGRIQQVYLRGKLAYDKDTDFDQFSPLGKLL